MPLVFILVLAFCVISTSSAKASKWFTFHNCNEATLQQWLQEHPELWVAIQYHRANNRAEVIPGIEPVVTRLIAEGRATYVTPRMLFKSLRP